MTAQLPVLQLEARPDPWRAWLASLWAHRHVVVMLARADFHARYKRAVLGVGWAVVLPLAQAALLTFVFSRLIRVEASGRFAVFVLSGVFAWSYFSTTVSVGGTAIVEGAFLTDKVWFPRAILALVPGLANLVGLGVTLAVLVVAAPAFEVPLRPTILALPAAVALLIAFSLSLSLALSALHVYFRDVRFLLQAAMLLWFYVTPIAYPKQMLGGAAGLLDANPMTGVVTLFRVAVMGTETGWVRPVVVAVAVTVALTGIGLEAQRRHDRLFADLL